MTEVRAIAKSVLTEVKNQDEQVVIEAKVSAVLSYLDQNHTGWGSINQSWSDWGLGQFSLAVQQQIIAELGNKGWLATRSTIGYHRDEEASLSIKASPEKSTELLPRRCQIAIARINPLLATRYPESFDKKVEITLREIGVNSEDQALITALKEAFQTAGNDWKVELDYVGVGHDEEAGLIFS
jgi:hypothetical protein